MHSCDFRVILTVINFSCEHISPGISCNWGIGLIVSSSCQFPVRRMMIRDLRSLFVIMVYLVCETNSSNSSRALAVMVAQFSQPVHTSLGSSLVVGSENFLLPARFIV